MLVRVFGGLMCAGEGGWWFDVCYIVRVFDEF